MTSPPGVLALLMLLASAASAGQAPETLPASGAPLRLVGVATDPSRPALAAAFIQCGDPGEKRPAWPYAVGARACGLVEIREVQAESVVVRNLATDRLERVVLPASGTLPVRQVYPPSAAAPAPTATDDARPVVRVTAPDVITVELRRDELRRHLSDLSGVLGAALATPLYGSGGTGSGALDGFEMSRIKPGGIVEQLGIRNGDVLLTFDGQRLDSLTAVMALLGRAENLSGSQMTVRRNGSTLTFVFEVK